MVEFGLVMIIFSLLTLALVQAISRTYQMDQARLQGDVLELIRSQVARLITDNRQAYQNGQDFQVGGRPFVNGDGVGQTRRPTLAQLRPLYSALSTVPDIGSYKTLSNARYQIFINRPDICNVNTLDLQCEITGLVCLDQPLTEHNGDYDVEGITNIMGRIGGNAGVSLITAPGTLSGESGWRRPNPFGQRASTICALVNTQATTNVVAGGGGNPPTGNCNWAELINTGNGMGTVVARALNCIQRVWMHGPSGTLNVANEQGNIRVQLGSTPEGLGDARTDQLRITNAAGDNRVVLSTNRTAGFGDILTDQLRNHDTTAGMDRTGRIYGDSGEFRLLSARNATIKESLTLLYEQFVNDPCSEVGGLAWGKYRSSGNNPRPRAARVVLVRCHLFEGATTPVWEFIGGLRQGSLNQSCPDVGEIAVTENMETLYCSGGTWSFLPDRMGRRVFYESRFIPITPGADGGTATYGAMEKPVCLPGVIGASIFLTGAAEEQRAQRITRYAVDHNDHWKVYQVDGDNRSVPGMVVAQTYCDY